MTQKLASVTNEATTPTQLFPRSKLHVILMPTSYNCTLGKEYRNFIQPKNQ